MRYHQPGGLKQHKFILSQFWNLEVRNQGAGGTRLPLKSLERMLPCLFQFLVVASDP